MKSCLKRKSFFAVGVCMALLALLGSVAHGRIITVRADGSGDYPTIQAAINDSNDGDAVVLEPGTYTGEGNRDIDFRGKTIIVKSENGPNNCIIDCETLGRGFHFHSGEDAASVLDGFTITNGYTESFGGGIYCKQSSPTITNCVISGNSDESAIGCEISNSKITNCIISNNNSVGIACRRTGSPTITNCIVSNNTGIGILCIHSSPTINNCTISDNNTGIHCAESSATIANCTITGNKAEDLSGGIYCEESSLTITNCVITGNSARSGGGIYCEDGNLIITNCTIAGNSSEGGERDSGGGIYCLYGNLTVSNCTIAGNSSEGERSSGGGIFCFGGNQTIISCTIAGNSSEGGEQDSGGGIFCYGNIQTITNCVITGNSARSGGGISCGGRVSSTITNCTITGNMANECGGGISVEGRRTTLVNCTITGNTAVEYGGGISCYGGTPAINNCILWGNEAPNGPQIYLEDNTNAWVSYTDIQGGQDDVYVGSDCILDWGPGNISDDPCFVEAGYWDANDTPTDVNDDFWIEGDYHLRKDSACIDAGDPNYIAEPNETDLDGNPRVFGDRIDMGAYEFYPNTVPNACIVGGDRTVEVGSGCEARVILDGSCSSDADSTPGTNDDINDFDWYEVIDACDPNSDIFLGSGEVIECNLPLGENDIILEVTDKAGAFDTNEVTITVEDTTQPEFSLSVEPSVLWPANHKMVEITPSWEVSDNCDEWPEVMLVSITINEDEATADDIQIGDGGIWLRAERSGTGSGRLYTITYTAVDDSGNVTQKSAAITVPHDRRRSK